MTPETVVGAPGGPPSSGASARLDHDPPVDWVTITTPATSGPRGPERPERLRRVILQLSAAAVVVLCLVAVAGSIVSKRTAESQSVHEDAEIADVIASSVVRPILTNAMANDPVAAKKVLNGVVHTRILSDMVVRVKMWTPQGRIIYSDDPRLVGLTFPLDDEAVGALTKQQTRAAVSDLSAPENRFERLQGRKLLEVYSPVWTPRGDPLLFETYFPYGTVNQRASEMWRGFVGIMLSSLAAIFVLLLPLVWTLLAKVRRGQAQREALMQRALDASLEERQRIAATLHDGAVQELAAASFAVAGGAETAATRGDALLAHELRDAAGAVRTSIGGLRSLLVDIYPPALRTAGLSAALRDLVATMAGRGPSVVLDVEEAAAAGLPPDDQAAVFRIVQELLRNVVHHAHADHVIVSMRRHGAAVHVTVTDDGVGFDPARTATHDHFGLRVISDVAVGIGAGLEVQAAPGHGATWRLTVPKR
jgi:two-component system, NarL family, sensor kinase